MALTGIHVVNTKLAVVFGASLPSTPNWSQTMNTPGTTASGAVADQAGIFQVSAGQDAYFAIGQAPNASGATGSGSAARYFIQAGTTREVFCQTGDKLAWVAA